MKLTIEKIDFDLNKRIIVTSDIHGDEDGFCGFLKQVNFSSQDILVIVGDILGRGSQQLQLLKHVQTIKNLYMVLGNHDTLFMEWEDDKEMFEYVHRVEHHIIKEMAMELQLPYATFEEFLTLKKQIYDVYKKDIEFLENLPIILDTNIATFVHAGLKEGKQDLDYCLSAKAFGNETHKFGKLVVVGHWPSSNYSQAYINVNPNFNEATNVISIDGGNSMKRWRQINYLIFDGNMTMGYYDHLPKIKAKTYQPCNQNPITVLFPNTEVEILESGEETSLCFLPYLQTTKILNNKKLYPYKGKVYCSDFTDYLLEVNVGDLLSICDINDAGLLVKKNGIVGYYAGEYEPWSNKNI